MVLSLQQYKAVKLNGRGLTDRAESNVGVGLLDFMVRPQIDPKTNEMLPVYGSFNDADMMKTQPRDAIPLIYVIKANGKLNSEIYSNAYSQIYTGHVAFLIKEQEAKNKLMATKTGQKMKIEDRVKRLMPHEMTTILYNELANLKLRQTGNQQDIVLEQINSRFGKDKVSAMVYGLWRIKEIEEDYIRNNARRNKGKRQLIFYTPGG